MAALVVGSGLILTGCGTRVGHDAIQADAGGGTVRLEQATLDQLGTGPNNRPAAVAATGPAARDQPITTADILTGLGRVKNETLGGLSPPITFSPGQSSAPPVRCIYFELLSEQGWTAPRGSKYVCS